MRLCKILRYFQNNELIITHTRSDNFVMVWSNSISQVFQVDLTSLNIPMSVQVFLPCPCSLGGFRSYGSNQSIRCKNAPFHFLSPMAAKEAADWIDSREIARQCGRSASEHADRAGNPFLTLSCGSKNGLDGNEACLPRVKTHFPRNSTIKYASKLLLVSWSRITLT